MRRGRGSRVFFSTVSLVLAMVWLVPVLHADRLIFSDDFNDNDLSDKWVSGACPPYANTIVATNGRVRATENCNYIETLSRFSGNLRIEVEVHKEGLRNYPCWDFGVAVLVQTGMLLFDHQGFDAINVGDGSQICADRYLMNGAAPNTGTATLTYEPPQLQFSFVNTSGGRLTTDRIDIGSWSAFPVRIWLAGFPDSPRYIDNVRIYEIGSTWQQAYDLLFEVPADIAVFRNFRDHILAKTPRGRLYSSLLYTGQDKALDVLLQNPSLLREAKAILSSNKGAIIDVLGGQEGVIHDTSRIVRFLEAFAANSPPELRRLTQLVKREILLKHKEGTPFFGLRLLQ